jgi:hypothetical protein
MPAPEVMRAQTTPECGALIETGLINAPFLPQNHTAFTDSVREKLSIAQNPTSSGTEIVFTFEKQSTLLEDVALLMTPPALNIPGSTYARYVDYLGIAGIKEFTWRYGGNTIQTYYPDQVYERVIRLNDEHRYNADFLALGNLSAAARNTYALAPREVRFKIPTPWEDMLCHSPLICGLANKLTLVVKLQDAASIIQTDGLKPPQIVWTNIHLDYQVIHTTGEVRSNFVGLSLQPEGISYLVDDPQITNFQIPANYFTPASRFTASLTDLDGPIPYVTLFVRETDALNPTLPNPAPYEFNVAYIEDMRYDLRSNNMNLVDPSLVVQDDVRQTDKFWECRLSTGAITLNWAEFPAVKNTSSGLLAFGNFTNPTLSLSNPSLLGNHPELTLTIISHRFNWTVQQAGNYQKVWR